MSTAANFANRVTERVRLILRAEKVAPNAIFDAGATDMEIMSKAVSLACGPESIDGKTADYIHARFDHLAAEVPIDPVRQVLAARVDRRH